MRFWIIFFSVSIIVLIIIFKSNNYSNIQIEKETGSILLDSIPDGIKKLLKVYPNKIITGRKNSIIWYDSTEMVYDDGVGDKSFQELLNSPDLEDQISAMKYNTVDSLFIPKYNSDPGRIRFEPFFRKMYGESREDVLDSLVEIEWLPNSVNKKLLVSKINNIDRQLFKISEKLDGKPHLTKFLSNPGGTFNWRKISGTDRISTHSFGITIDINVKYSNYWQWDYRNWTDLNPKDTLRYQNSIPLEIVKVFEQNGFIWGGRWYHYDTMHFEYRPELL